MNQYVIDLIWKLGITLLSAKGLWELIKTLAYRIKIKAESDNIIAGTYKDLIVNVRYELAEVRKENMDLMKQLGQIKLTHQKEMEEERRSCSEQMAVMMERIRELESIVNPKKSNL